MPIIKKRKKDKKKKKISVGKDVEKLEHLYTVGGSVKYRYIIRQDQAKVFIFLLLFHVPLRFSYPDYSNFIKELRIFPYL